MRKRIIMFNLFSKNMGNQSQQSGTMYNAITSGSKIIGTIIADGDIRIDGTVEGEMQCAGKVVIGEKGLVYLGLLSVC